MLYYLRKQGFGFYFHKEEGFEIYYLKEQGYSLMSPFKINIMAIYMICTFMYNNKS